mgnify:CR=1 FL=1|tara:strand:- start:216 stop:656 length:441 start_codon:yes stop_codon:yes gene_type:complete
MATLTPTLTLASTDAFASQPFSLSVTDSLTVAAPMTDISTMNTDDDIGNGAGVIIGEDTNQYYVYVKHTGKLASDGTTASHATNDFVTLGDVDGTAGLTVKLQPDEFAFFPTKEGDGSSGSGGDGGVKVTAGSAAVRIEFAYWKRG